MVPTKIATATVGKQHVIVLNGGTNNIVNGHCTEFAEVLDNFLAMLSGLRAVLVGLLL